MASGRVKTVTGKGFGFIETSDSERDVFYHETRLPAELADRKLRVGDKVNFDIENTDRGTNATNIKLVEDEA